MTDKKRNYQSDILALPPLRMILSDIPEPDPNDKRHTSRARFSGEEQSEAEARNVVAKLIGHLKSNEK